MAEEAQNMKTNQEFKRNEKIPYIHRRFSMDVSKGSSKGGEVPLSQRRMSCDVAMKPSNTGLPALISKRLSLDLAKLQSAVGSTQDRRTDDKRTDYSKIKEFAHDYLKLDDNGGEFSKWVENTVGKRRNCADPNYSGIPALLSRRISLDCAKERLDLERAMPLHRRVSLDTAEECRKSRPVQPTKRRVSFDISKMHTKYGIDQNAKRRESLDIAKEEPGSIKDMAIQRRVSLDIGKRSHLLRSSSIPKALDEETQEVLQRHENKLPELFTSDPSKEKLQQRRYTVINAPAQLHVQKKYPMKKQRSQPAFETTVCPLASKMANKLKFEPEVDESDADEINMNANFVPKPCWCLRCQIMLCMFRTGDKQLEVWGNYPCFRR